MAGQRLVIEVMFVVVAALMLAGCRAAPAVPIPFSFNGVVGSSSRVQAIKPLTDQLKAMLTRNQPSELRASFSQFKAAVSRKYATAAEEEMRYSLYLKKLARIAEVNSDPTLTYVLGVNEFSDRTPAEIQARLMHNKPAAAGTTLGRRMAAANDAAATPPTIVKRKLQATGVDWRSAGKVSPVKDQGQCGSCWAFAATAAIESAYLISYGVTADLSEQLVVSCSGAGSCNGGESVGAMNYFVKNTLIVESGFGYQATDVKCSSASAAIKSSPGVSLSATAKTVKGDVTALQQAIARQPAVLYFTVEDDFASLADGIYNPPSCSSSTNHAMLVVGYGWDAKNNGYWIIKNSWGSNWNSKGYIKVAMMDGGDGVCGMYVDGFMYPDLSPADKGFDKLLSSSAVTCTSGTYASGSACLPCAGSGATSPNGATSESECTCKPGGNKFYQLGNGCTLCDPATTTKVSSDGSTCECDVNYDNWSQDTGACESTGAGCPAGTFDAGDGSCTTCLGGADSNSGATSESECFCTSDTDYYVVGEGCNTCDPDSTTGSSDGQTCDCADGFQDWDPATGACTDSSAVVCDSGQYEEGGKCVDCAGDGSALTDSGATSEEECYCEPGGMAYYKLGEGCVDCDYDTTDGSEDGTTCTCTTNWQDWDPDTGACLTLECTSGYYLQDGDNGPECVACAGVGNAVTPLGATSESDCRCPATNFKVWYYQPGYGCARCGAGTTGKSNDGQTCPCSPGFSNFNPSTGTCTKAGPCTKKNQACGPLKNACCAGLTCKKIGAAQKCG